MELARFLDGQDLTWYDHALNLEYQCSTSQLILISPTSLPVSL